MFCDTQSHKLQVEMDTGNQSGWPLIYYYYCLHRQFIYFVSYPSGSGTGQSQMEIECMIRYGYDDFVLG